MKKTIFETEKHSIVVADHGHELVYTLFCGETPVNATVTDVCVKHLEYRGFMEFQAACTQCAIIRSIVKMYKDQINQAEAR